MRADELMIIALAELRQHERNERILARKYHRKAEDACVSDGHAASWLHTAPVLQGSRRHEWRQSCERRGRRISGVI